MNTNDNVHSTVTMNAHLLHGHRIVSLPREAIERQELDDPTFGNLEDIN